MDIWETSIEAWKKYPHFGSGLGTFREAFREAQPHQLSMLVEQAHNDSLQLLVTGGWTGFAFGVIAILSFGVALVRAWRRQQSSTDAAIALAAIGALFSLLVHGLVEFNFSIPAIPTTLAIILGAGWSAATASDSAGAGARRTSARRSTPTDQARSESPEDPQRRQNG